MRPRLESLKCRLLRFIVRRIVRHIYDGSIKRQNETNRLHDIKIDYIIVIRSYPVRMTQFLAEDKSPALHKTRSI